MISLSVVAILFWYFPSSAGLLYNHQQLKAKNREAMSALVQAKVQEAQKDRGSKIVPLKEALQAILSRPDEDQLAGELIPIVKEELDGMQEWERALSALVDEAAGALQNPRAFGPKVLSTYQVFLDNFLRIYGEKADSSDFLKTQVEKVHKLKERLSDTKDN